jgi:type I restriction enzyme S subunit
LNRQLVIVDRAKAAAKERLRAANALAPAYVMREFTGGQSKQWPRKTLQTLSLGNGQYGTSQKSHPTEAPGTVPVLGIGNIKGGAVVWHRLKFTSLSSEDGVKYRLKAGDLIFCRTNSAELVGETAVFDGSRDAAFASYLVRFRLNPELADPRFVSTYINSPWGRHFIQQNLSRAIGQANVSASVVANMEIPAPPVAVQRSIMDRLAHATAGVGRLAQQVSEELHSISRMPTALLRAAFQGDT